VIGADDIVFADFGPIFEECEADFGRTFVLGDDPVKHRLREDLPKVFAVGTRHFAEHDHITGKQFFAEVERLAVIWGAGTRGTWWASSRTRRSTAPTRSRASPRPTTPHSVVPTMRAVPVT
jgi:hypothetical protein